MEDTKYNGLLFYFYKYSVCVLLFLVIVMCDSSTAERDESDQFNSFLDWHENIQYKTTRRYKRRDHYQRGAEMLKVYSSITERDENERFNSFLEWHENIIFQTTKRNSNQRGAESLPVYTSTPGKYRHGRLQITGLPSRTNRIHSKVDSGGYVNSIEAKWTTGPSWRIYGGESHRREPEVDLTTGSKSESSIDMSLDIGTENTSDTSEEVAEIPDTVKAFNKVPIFYDRDTIMDVFDIERKGHQVLVTEMMANYEHICLAKPDVPTPPPGKRKPFIVIEGNHRPSRKIVAQRLAERLGGRSLDTPRKCLAQFVEKFPRGTKLRRAFFGLALYASEYKVRQLWDRSIATVMDGYWLDQTSLIIAWMFRMNSTLPRAGNQIYSWPVDLMEPDIIFYINVPNIATPKSTNTWMSLVPHVYKRIKYPKVVILIPKGGVNKTAEAMHDYIKKTLWKECDLSNTTPVPDSVHNEYDVLY